MAHAPDAQPLAAPIATKDPFAYHKPSPQGLEAITNLRREFRHLHEVLLGLDPCRERSLAITKLEEAAMWAIKGVVIHDPGSVTE